MTPQEMKTFQDSLENSAETETSIIPPHQKKEWLAFIRQAAINTKKKNQEPSVHIRFTREYLDMFQGWAKVSGMKYELENA